MSSDAFRDEVRAAGDVPPARRCIPPEPGYGTPREQVQRLEAVIADHAERAARWADKATDAADDHDDVYACAAKAQAHAAAAQALALLRTTVRPGGNLR